MWGDRIFHSCNLLHHLFINGQAASRIHNNSIISFKLCLFNSSFGNLYRIHIPILGVNRYSDLLSNNFQLIDGRRPVNVPGNQ